MGESIFCSIIIPTIGRSTLGRAVFSVLNQDFSQAGYEVIVVNDSGHPLEEAEWQSFPHIHVLNTNQRERCFARNSGAAVAQGDYLGFLDDDDWFLPGAIEQFWQLSRQFPEAVWLYGGIQVLDGKGNCLAEINSSLKGYCFSQIMGGAWAPLQASLVRTQTFFELGGFNPSINGTEDEDLARRFSYKGDFANTTAPVACLFRGHAWKTSTNYTRATQDRKVSMDLVLNERYAFQRLMVSAKTSYWFGRNCRGYFSLVNWNLKQGRLFRALSRGGYGLASIIVSGKHLFTQAFWEGFKAHHAPNTLHFVMEAYEREKKISPI